GALDVAAVIGARADRRRWRRSQRVALLGAADGTASQYADHDDPHVGGLGVAEEVAVILRGVTRRHRRSRARVQQIVAGLCGVEGFRIDDAVQGCGLAVRGDAETPELALRAQPLE